MAKSIKINNRDCKTDVHKKLQEFLVPKADVNPQSSKDRRKELNKFFGILKLKDNTLELQRKWRDEW